MPAFVVVAIGGLGSFAGAVIAGPAGRRRHRAHHPVLARGLGRGDVPLHGADAAAAPARPAGRALGALRMSAPMASGAIPCCSSCWCWPGSACSGTAIGAPISLITQIAIYTLYGAGVCLLVELYRPGAVRRLGVLRLRHLCRGVRAAATASATRSWRWSSRVRLLAAARPPCIAADHPAPPRPLFLAADARLLADRLRDRLQMDRRDRRRERVAGRAAAAVRRRPGRSTSSRSSTVALGTGAAVAHRPFAVRPRRCRRCATTSSARRAWATTRSG